MRTNNNLILRRLEPVLDYKMFLICGRVCYELTKVILNSKNWYQTLVLKLSGIQNIFQSYQLQ